MCGILGLGLLPECVVDTGIHLFGFIAGVLLIGIGVLVALRGAPRAGVLALVGGATVLAFTQ